MVSGVSAVPPLRTPPLRQTVDLSCRALAPNGCDVHSESCQRQLFELARCLAAREGAQPPLRFISEAESRQLLLKHRAETSRTRGGLEQAVRVLGLGSIPATAETSNRETRLAPHTYYSPSERTVFLVSNDPASYGGEVAALSLVHEYVHAIQDHQGELLRMQNGGDARSFDQELALRSAFEGEAAWQTCWDSPQTAAKMQELIELQLRESSSNRASVTQAAHRVTATLRAEGRPDLATNTSEP